MIKKPPQEITRHLWAYVDSGRLIADSLFETEEDAWRIALGWPAPEEIEHAKKAGGRVVKVKMEFTYND